MELKDKYQILFEQREKTSAENKNRNLAKIGTKITADNIAEAIEHGNWTSGVIGYYITGVFNNKENNEIINNIRLENKLF
jgi:hypothetical protein